MENQPLISVIVPIYNVEEYLDQCINSIANQTYKNLEIILVDDGSLDNSPQICDKWAESDSRIKVIHKKNGGQGEARNFGLSIAKGSYIGFVDGDDLIDTKMYGTLMDHIDKYGCDIAVCDFLSFVNDISVDHANERITVLNTVDSLRELLRYGKVKGVVWDKLYDRRIITALFEPDKACEDTFWMYQIVGNGEKTVITDYIGYYYRQRESSTTGKYRIEFLDAIEARRNRLAYFSANYPELVNEAKREFFFHCLNQYQKALDNINDKESRKKTLGFIRNQMKEEQAFSYSYMKNGKEKIWMFLSKLSVDFTCRIRNRFHIGL